MMQMIGTPNALLQGIPNALLQGTPNISFVRISYVKTWNERLKSRRLELVISPAQFARDVGVKPPTVFEWEEGITKKLKGENLLKIAVVLKCSPQWLLTGRGANEDVRRDEARQIENPPPPLHQHDYDLVSAYNNLPDDMRTVVWDVIDGYLRRHVKGYAVAAGVRDVALAIKGDGAKREKHDQTVLRPRIKAGSNAKS